MITIKEYAAPDSLEEAYNLLMKKKANTILGGTTFLRMGSKNIFTAIDLKNLNLDKIIEDDGYIKIGSKCTQRMIELDEKIKVYCNGIISEAIANIVGVQFRNVATIGASVFAKYGFSDIIPTMLAVQAKVKLYNQGIIAIDDFLKQDLKKDILEEIWLPKDAESGTGTFECIRNSCSDFAILNGAVFIKDDVCRIIIGARPMGANLAEAASDYVIENRNMEKQVLIENAANIGAEELTFGSNMRGSSEYRKEMCKVLIKRMLRKSLANE